MQIEVRLRDLGSAVRSEVLAVRELDDMVFPVYKLTFGSEDPKAPTLGIVGGVHGLERIGSQVCVSLLNTFSELVLWDKSLQRTLQDLRVFFIPTVNPVGIHRKTRSNPEGIDLMRNAPIDADNAQFLLGGHRYSPRLPWYRGQVGQPMQMESQALVDAVQREISQSTFALTLDLHSGFGLQDRLWFPYAKTTKPYPELDVVYGFKELLDRTYPHHFYRVEPQAKHYTTHGDLWDYLYDQHRAEHPESIYLPLCLEMGSWMWVKKNPWQLFTAEGPFNPLIGHRHQRTLRRHNTLMEFLIRAMTARDVWIPQNPQQKQNFMNNAMELWYGEK
jgi:hypothetical protein